MRPFDLFIFREALSAGRVEWRKHVLHKIVERGLSLEVSEFATRQDDKPFPSALFLGYHDGTPLHVVAACDEAQRRVFVITAYEPSLEIFEPDFKTKRK